MSASAFARIAALALVPFGLALPIDARELPSSEVSAASSLTLRSGTLTPREEQEVTQRAATAGEALVVRLDAPAGARARAALFDAELRPVAPLGADAFVVWRPAGVVVEAAGVAWAEPLAPALRVAPEIAALESADERAYPATLHVFGHADVDAIAARLRALGVEVSATRPGSPATPARSERMGRLVLRADAAALARVREHVASWPETFWLGRRTRYRLLNDQSAWVGQAGLERPGETPVHDRGLLGEGQIVAVLDTGLDADMCYFREEDGSLPPTALGFDVGAPDFSRRKVGIVSFLWDQESPADPNDWDTQDHGTHVAGSVAGDDLATIGARDSGDGMAPMAQLVIQDGGYATDDCADLPAIGCPAASLYPFFELAHEQGAHIHSNSYGDRENFTPYNIYSDGSEDADRFMRDHPEFLLVFAAGNNGGTTATVASPATAKNVVAVGATAPGASAGGLASFSSKGPTHDGRIKPDVTAPGSGIVSANNDGNVQSNNCNVKSSSGTSMACPTVAGLAALVREYFNAGFHPGGERDAADAFTPSAALLKAALIASAAPMEEVGAPPPSDPQGWGRVLLDDVLYFPGDRKRLFVEDERGGFEDPSDPERSYELRVLDTSEPLRVVLTWTDEPSTPAAAINLVNDLDLEALSPSGTLYRGNVFAEGASVTGGTPDRLNNVEALRIEAPEPGLWTIRARAHAVPVPPQDFALVATGRLPARGVTLERVDLVIDDSVGGNGDGLADPGEWIDLPLTLLNSGDASASEVAARLASPSPFVEVVLPSASYPDLASGESAPPSGAALRLRVSPELPCGEPLPLVLSYESQSSLDEESLDLPSGREEVIVHDSLEGATGWAHVAAESSASTGDWVVDDPDGTDYQPEDDVSEAPGVRALFTAPNPSGGAGTDDIDEGVVVARSGPYDLSGHPDARLRVWRWFANRDVGDDAGDFFRLEIRESASSPDVLLEELSDDVNEPRWVERHFRVADFVTPGASIELKVSAADGAAQPSLVEAALDELLFWEPACSTWMPAPRVVDTLLVEREGADLVLRWNEPGIDPEHGEAARYRVWRSLQVDGGFDEQALVDAPATTWRDVGAGSDAATLYSYSVVSENAGGASEPSP